MNLLAAQMTCKILRKVWGLKWMGNVIFLRTVLRVWRRMGNLSVFHPLCDGGLSTKERERV